MHVLAVPVVVAPLAFPVIEALLAGVVALILWLARNLVGRFVGGFLRSIPVVGSAVGGAVDRLLIDAWNAVFSFVSTAVGAVEHAFDSPATAVREMMAAEAAAFANLHSAYDWLKTTWVWDWYLRAVGEAETLAGQVRSYVDDTVVPDISRVVEGVEHQVTDTALRVLADESELAHLASTVYGTLTADVGLVGTELHDALGELAKLPGFVETEVAAGVRYAEGAASDLVDRLRADIAAAIQSGSGLAVGGLAALIGTIASDATVAADFARGCGQDMCNWFTPNKGSLGSLFADVDLTVFIALVVAATTDPAATAGVLAGMASDIKALGDDVLAPFGITG